MFSLADMRASPTQMAEDLAADHVLPLTLCNHVYSSFTSAYQ